MEIRSSRCIHTVLLIAEIAKDRDRQMKPSRLKHDGIATQIGRSWRLHVSSSKPTDRCHLFRYFAHAIISDRVDSGPHDRRFALGSDGSYATTHPAKVSNVWDIVPHGEKHRNS